VASLLDLDLDLVEEVSTHGISAACQEARRRRRRATRDQNKHGLSVVVLVSNRSLKDVMEVSVVAVNRHQPLR
jgi:hypothetical protein